MSEQECNVLIRNNRIGALIPRTCAECGLGPCRYVEQPPATKASSNPEIERLNQIIDNLNAALRAKPHEPREDFVKLQRENDACVGIANSYRIRAEAAEQSLSKIKGQLEYREGVNQRIQEEVNRLKSECDHLQGLHKFERQRADSLKEELDALKRDKMREVKEVPASAPSAAPQSDGFELTCSQCGKTFRSKHAHDTMCDNCIQF